MTVTQPNRPARIPTGQSPRVLPPPGHPQGPAAGLPGRSERRTVLHALLHGTPGRMRLLGALAVLAALLLGIVCANALLGSQAAADRAANNIAQVVRAQSIHVDLLRADALATNAFLVGGRETAEHRAQFDAAMTSVVEGLTQAAAAQPADGKALAALSDQVQTYATLVEQARSNNRLGLPVGAQYLTQASAGLRSDAIPIIDAIVKANEGRSQAEFARADSSGLLLLGLLSVLVLIGIAVWLARRTHRYLNGPFTIAIVLVAVGLFLATSAISSVGVTVGEVQRSEYQTAIRLAEASTAANDARANESLTLIKRGSGAAFEKAWQADDTLVKDRLADHPDLLDAWRAYETGHTKVRGLDGDGNWDGAVALATSTADDAPGTRFAEFDRDLTTTRDQASQAAIERVDGVGGTAPVYAIGIGLLALVACWLIIRGVGKRIEEYK